MPLTIDPKMIDALVQRQIAAQQAQVAPAQSDEERGGPSTLAKILYASGGGADAASTLYGLKTGLGRENNPMVNWAPKNAQVPIGAAMEVDSLALLNKILGKKHPKIMSAAMMGLGALHGGLAATNMKMLAGAKKEQAAAGARQPDSIPSNLVPHPDGGYYDPDFFAQK